VCMCVRARERENDSERERARARASERLVCAPPRAMQGGRWDPSALMIATFHGAITHRLLVPHRTAFSLDSRVGAWTGRPGKGRCPYDCDCDEVVL
jgi:hypothetical protein